MIHFVDLPSLSSLNAVTQSGETETLLTEHMSVHVFELAQEFALGWEG